MISRLTNYYKIMKKSSFEKNIGIIGLGVLGSAIAKNFIDKNISISGYDINEKVFEGLKSNKIKAYNSIDKISDMCKFLITSLASETSLLNVAKSLSKNDRLIIIETSTLPLDCKLEVKNILLEKKITIFDAPLSGNRIAALEGKLSAYLSGYDKNKKEVVLTLDNISDVIRMYSSVKCIITPNIYSSSGKFGVTWKVWQMKIWEPEGGNVQLNRRSYAMVDSSSEDEDDNVDCKNDESDDSD